MITQREFEKVLVGNGYKNLLPHIKRELYQIFVERDYDFKTANSILNGARRMAILSRESQEMVTVDILDLFKNHCSKLDEIKYQKIDAVVRRFKEYYTKRKIKTPKIEDMIKEIYVAIKSRSDAVNKDLADFTDQEISSMFIVASIYNSINNHIDAGAEEVRGADTIVGEKLAQAIVNNQNIVIDETLRTNAEELMDSLTKEISYLPEDETFSGEELKRLLKHTTSIIYATDASKATDARVILRNYIETLKLEIEKGTPEEEFLSTLTAKKLLLKSGSLLISPDTLSVGIDLVSGKSIKESIKPSGKGKKEQAQLLALFPDLKIEGFTPKKQTYFIYNSPSLYSDLGGAKTFKSVTQIVDGIAFGLLGLSAESTPEERIEAVNQKGFNTNALLHADNINELISGEVLKSAAAKRNFGENLVTLSRILKPADVQKIIQHNIGLLCEDPQIISQNISNIIQSAGGDSKKIKDGLEGYVNTLVVGKSEGVAHFSGAYSRDSSDGVSLASEKEYIELDIHWNIPAKSSIKKLEITKDNYQDLLFVELSQLNLYLDSRLEKVDAIPQDGSLGAYLKKFDSGNYTVSDKGGATRKIRQIAEMIEFLKAEKNPPEGLKRTVEIIKEKLSNLDLILDLSIEETEAIGDELVKDESTRAKIEGEILSEYEAELKRLENVRMRSRGLKAKQGEDIAFIEEKIEYLKTQIAEIHANKGIMHLAYAERAGYMIEYECAKKIGEILADTQGPAIQSLEPIRSQEDELQKRRTYQALVDVFNNNMRKFSNTYKTAKARESAHAKKWLEKIARLNEKLVQLNDELEKQ